MNPPDDGPKVVGFVVGLITADGAIAELLSRLCRSGSILSMAAGPLLRKCGVVNDRDSFLWGRFCPPREAGGRPLHPN